jgi:hypothetical protein
MPETECSPLDKLRDHQVAGSPRNNHYDVVRPSTCRMSRCRQRRSIVGTVSHEMQRSRAVHRPHSGGLANSSPKHRSTCGYGRSRTSYEQSSLATRWRTKVRLHEPKRMFPIRAIHFRSGTHNVSRVRYTTTRAAQCFLKHRCTTAQPAILHWYTWFTDVVRDWPVGICGIRYHDAPTRMSLTMASFWIFHLPNATAEVSPSVAYIFRYDLSLEPTHAGRHFPRSTTHVYCGGG